MDADRKIKRENDSEDELEIIKTISKRVGTSKKTRDANKNYNYFSSDENNTSDSIERTPTVQERESENEQSENEEINTNSQNSFSQIQQVPPEMNQDENNTYSSEKSSASEEEANARTSRKKTRGP